MLGTGLKNKGKKIESYTKRKQDQREPFSEFTHRLSKAVQVGVTNMV